MKSCSSCCIANDVSCPVGQYDKKNHPNGCKYWINYEKDLNCALISINKCGPMGLREIADRLGISYVRVKQIQDKSLKRVKKLISIKKIIPYIDK